MTTIKHAGQGGLTIAAFVAGSAAAVYGAKIVADGFVYLGALAFG